MGLKVLDPGLWTTVQDRGRMGYREWGVPLGGAFDRGSADLANALLGNSPAAAVLEMTLRGGEYEATGSLGIALAGAPMDARVLKAEGRSRALGMPSSTTLLAGDRLILGRASSGVRTYLGVGRGLLTEPRLGSRSTERPLVRGELLPASESRIPTRHLADGVGNVSPSTIRILNGPDHAALLEPEQISTISFRVGSRSNRMGLHLESPLVEARTSPDRLSAPVAPGTIQLAGSQLIILGVASGTMGGYPHVAQVISADIDRVGQLRPGDLIRLERVTLREARALDRDARQAHRARLVRLAASIGND